MSMRRFRRQGRGGQDPEDEFRDILFGIGTLAVFTAIAVIGVMVRAGFFNWDPRNPLLVARHHVGMLDAAQS